MLEDERTTPTAAILKDTDGKKRYPNSIAAIFRTVMRFWLKKTKPSDFSGTSVQEFLDGSNYEAIYLGVRARYPGRSRWPGQRLSPKHARTKHHRLKDMMDDLSAQATDLDYPQLRALSDFLGVSESACMLIAKLISLERRINDPKERREGMTQLLDAHRRMIDKATELAFSSDGPSFAKVHQTDKAPNLWLADVDALHDLVSSYRDGDLSVVDHAMENN